MTKVSVIIPVYNAEQSVEKTIESCLSQTLDSLEIICINDGSTDASEKILEGYENKKRIVLINQNNKGTGVARNVGISKATGEFLFFMDADDCFPSNDILYELYHEAKRNNVKICGGNAVLERNGKMIECDKTHPTYGKFLCPEIGLCDYFEHQFFVGFTRFLYQSEFIKNNYILFPEITEYEDPFFMVQAFYYARFFYAIDKSVYQIHRGEHIRTYNNHNKVKEAFWGIGKVLEFANNMRLSKLQCAILDDIYNTRFNIFMYPFLNNDSELINLERKIVKYINYELLTIEGKEELFISFQEEAVLKEIKKTVDIQRIFDGVLRQEKEIYIFGAGVIAERVFQYALKKNVIVKGFVVSSMEGNPLMIHGIKVLTLENRVINLESMVVVALASTEGIKQKLEKLGYKKIFLLDFSKLRLVL